MASLRTKKVKKLRTLFSILSFIMWVGTTVVYVACLFSKLKTTGEASGVSEEVVESGIEIFTESAKQLALSIGTTAIIGILASIIIKDKLRTFIWMLNVILGSILFSEVGMYVTLGLWFIEEYVIHALYLHYKNLVSINKEIDLREE